MNSKNHNHGNGMECEVCKNGIEAVHKKEAELLKNPGWYAHFIPGDTNFPFSMNIHTHGLVENYGHPDLQICLSMHSNVAHQILINAIELFIKKDKSFEAGQKYDDLITPAKQNSGMDYKVLFLEAEEGGRKVLRMVIPDKDGGFDGPLSSQLDGCVIPAGLKLSA